MEAHKYAVNTINTVVFNVPKFLPLPLVKVTILKACSTALVSAVDAGEGPKNSAILLQFHDKLSAQESTSKNDHCRSQAI